MFTRKYASGYEKLKKRKKEEKLIESKKWSMDKFVSNKQNITQNLDENITNEQEIHQNNLEEMMCNFAIQQILIMNFKII